MDCGWPSPVLHQWWNEVPGTNLHPVRKKRKIFYHKICVSFCWMLLQCLCWFLWQISLVAIPNTLKHSPVDDKPQVVEWQAAINWVTLLYYNGTKEVIDLRFVLYCASSRSSQSLQSLRQEEIHTFWWWTFRAFGSLEANRGSFYSECAMQSKSMCSALKCSLGNSAFGTNYTSWKKW